MASELYIVGTGFFVSNAGYVMTANHVARSYLEAIQQNMDAGLVAIRLIYLPGGSFRVFGMDMQQPYIVKLGGPTEAEKRDISRGIDLDVAILKPKPGMVSGETPFLPIKNTPRPKLYDEITMCGYPGGKYSLDFLTEEALELRLSPVMQFGRIAGLLPTDNTEYPSAIQTDIIGTDGSSGSPIVDLCSGEATAIAQKVILADVVGDRIIDAVARIGLWSSS
jgi:S1-C subfamily serine protease